MKKELISSASRDLDDGNANRNSNVQLWSHCTRHGHPGAGKASLATPALPQGTNTITATYNGTVNIIGSSGFIVQQVN